MAPQMQNELRQPGRSKVKKETSTFLKSPSLLKKSNSLRKKGARRRSSRANVVDRRFSRINRTSMLFRKESLEISDDSKDFHDMQDFYYKQIADSPNQKMENEGGDLKELHLFSSNSTPIAISDTKQTFYNLLRRKLGRRRSIDKGKDISEFAEQVVEIKDAIRTPNDCRIHDLKVTDKTKLERLQDYQDRFPLLRLRRNILKIPRLFSNFLNTNCY